MRYIITLVLIFFLTACSQPGVEQYESISYDLPEDCYLVEFEEDETLPFGIPSNPFVTDSLEFLNVFSAQLLGDTMLAPFSKEGLFSRYQGSVENGINAIRFDTPEIAAKALQKMNTAFPDTARFEIIQDGSILIHIWTDDPRDACYSALRRRVNELSRD